MVEATGFPILWTNASEEYTPVGPGILKVSQDSHGCWGPAWSHGAISQLPEHVVCNYPLMVTLKAGGGLGEGDRSRHYCPLEDEQLATLENSQRDSFIPG